MSIICSNDKQRFAKECLYLSLLRLLEKKSIKEITVTELCSNAGLSRAAFYRNYRIVEDIMEEHIRYDLSGGDLEEEYSRALGLENILIGYYRTLKENQKLLQLIVKSDLTYMLQKATDEMITKFSYLIPCSDKNPYIHAIYSAGTMALVIEWTKNDMDRSCEEMANLSMKLLEGISTCME